MNYHELGVPAPLDQLVHRIWFLRGTGDEPSQPVVPDGRVELILHRGEPFGRLDQADRLEHQSGELVAGQLLGPIRLVPRGAIDVVGIRFRSAGARSILGLPLHELAGHIEDLQAVRPDLARALRAAARARRPEDCVHAITQVLLRRAGPPPALLVRAAVQAMERPGPGIGALARRLGVTSRTLERQLRDEVGLAPKTLHRVLRFRRAFRLLDRTPRGAWARVAAASGYFDQAHLIREFRAFTGATPSRFFRAEPGLARNFVGEDDAAAGNGLAGKAP